MGIFKNNLNIRIRMRALAGAFPTVQVLLESLLSAYGVQSVHTDDPDRCPDHLLGTFGSLINYLNYLIL